jgi:hypothetical protein
MQPSREDVIARERRWALPVALATLSSVGLLVAATIVVRSVSGDGGAEVLRSVHEHSSAVTVSGILQAAAFLLLVAPLVYLFRAAAARSERVNGQLIGLVIVAPLFLSVAAILTGLSTNDAASEFAAGKATTDLTTAEARERCESDRESDEGSFREEFGQSPQGALRLARSRHILGSPVASRSPSRSSTAACGRCARAYCRGSGARWAWPWALPRSSS